MNVLKGACIIGQSGGPTSVINASAYGVIATALKDPHITRVTVTAGSTPVADGDLVTNGTSLTVAATADTGYDAVIYVNGVRQGVAPQPVTVSGNTNITVAAEARAGHTVQIADTLNTDPATCNF